MWPGNRLSKHSISNLRPGRLNANWKMTIQILKESSLRRFLLMNAEEKSTFVWLLMSVSLTQRLFLSLLRLLRRAATLTMSSLLNSSKRSVVVLKSTMKLVSRVSLMKTKSRSLNEACTLVLRRFAAWEEQNFQVARNKESLLPVLLSRIPRSLFWTKLLQLWTNSLRKSFNRRLTEQWREELQ